MKIKDICTSVTDGSHNPPQGIEKSEYMMLSSKNIFDDEITFDEPRFLSQKDFEREHKRTNIAVGDVLLTIVGTVGRTAVVDEDMPAFALQRSVAVLHPKNDVCLPRFLMYALRGKRTYIENRAKGVAQKGIYLKEVSDIDIYIPDISNQEIIINKLDKVNAIIKLRQEELLALDDLIKARFVEMFGDPQINPFGWDVVNISEVVGGKVSNGFFAKRDDYADDGNVSVLGVSNIVNRMYSNVDKLPKTNADDKDIEKFEVRYGDMLFCRSSLVTEGIGKASIVPENVQDNVLFECHVIRLPLDLSKCVPEFMQALSTMDFFRNQVVAQSKTATMTTIGQDGILKTDIILPPMDKQRTFYDFVHQVDKSKVAVQKALDETQMLFDSLMQEYFG
ncbi:MAG: restriction endonuclease subunit S [Agathobacter sp.]|uniref:restriction endonuclease subunit S n=1 Tax=Agathobacter sp. TaxID=2021311 RepID=UPI00399360F4